MKSNSIIREILMMTGSSFSEKQLCEMDQQDSNSQLTAAQQLEAACWNGILHELIPEIMQSPSGGEKLFLWQVETKKCCLRLSMGACAPILENQFTLDPYLFLCSQEMN